MAAVTNLQVTSEQHMQQAITSYIAQGYTVMNQSPGHTTMFKKKEFSVLWAVVGLLLCIVPLLIYLVIYASQQDQMVEIHMVDPSLQLEQSAPVSYAGQISPDGHWMWNGREWVANPNPAAQLPEEASGSDDRPPA